MHPELSGWALNPVASVLKKTHRGETQRRDEATHRWRQSLEGGGRRPEAQEAPGARILPWSLWRQHSSAVTLVSNS